MSDNTNEILKELQKKFGDNFIKVKDKLNQKQSLFDGIFQWNERYWEPATIKTQLIEALTPYELSGKKQDDLLQMVIESITLTQNTHGTDETDINCENLICTPDGVIDLEALKKYSIDHQKQWLRPHAEYKKRYITMCTQANYKPETEQNYFFYSLLEKYLLRFDEELKQWFCSFLGDLLLGENKSQQFVLFLGKTRSGKTTLLNFITSILGSYAFAISNDILSKEDDDLRKTLYRKRKCRLLHHDDPDDKIDVMAIKRLTGNSDISVKEINFRVPAHLIITSNYMPKNNDPAFIERMVPIPFGNTIPESERNMDMDNQLTRYRDDVFSLMVSSFYQLPIIEVKKPAIAQLVLEKYEMLNDPVKAFYDTYCEKTSANSPIKATELYQHFDRFRGDDPSKAIPEVNDFKTQLEIEGIFLFDEKVLKKDISQNKFNNRIKELHPKLTNHGHELTLNGIIFKEGKLYWGNSLDSKWDSPARKANEAVADGLNHAKGQIKTAFEPEKHQEKLKEQTYQEVQQPQWRYQYGCDYWCNGKDSTQCMIQNLCVVRHQWRCQYGCDYWCNGKDSTLCMIQWRCMIQWQRWCYQYGCYQCMEDSTQCMRQNLCVVRQNNQPANPNPSVSAPKPQTQEQDTSPSQIQADIDHLDYIMKLSQDSNYTYTVHRDKNGNLQYYRSRDIKNWEPADDVR